MILMFVSSGNIWPNKFEKNKNKSNKVKNVLGYHIKGVLMLSINNKFLILT